MNELNERTSQTKESNEQTSKQMNGWAEEWMDWRTDGRTDGRIDERTNKQTIEDGHSQGYVLSGSFYSVLETAWSSEPREGLSICSKGNT